MHRARLLSIAAAITILAALAGSLALAAYRGHVVEEKGEDHDHEFMIHHGRPAETGGALHQEERLPTAPGDPPTSGRPPPALPGAEKEGQAGTPDDPDHGLPGHRH